MRVALAPELQDSASALRAEAILRRCVHCGFCNTTCPTYVLLGDELDGPRGRIYQIKGMLETNMVDSSAASHLDRCLTCRNCETTCPSGVEYGELLEIGRQHVRTSTRSSTFIEQSLLRVVPYFRRLRLLVGLGRLIRWLLPKYLQRMLQPLKKLHDIPEDPGATITIFQGCAQRAMTPDVNQHLVKLLTARGVSVRMTSSEVCCGGLHLHLAHVDRAHELMSAYVQSMYDERTTAYLSTASGCGVTIKDYARYLDSEQAQELAARTMDVSEFLVDYSFTKHPNIRRVALHNPCTLQHGQKLTGSIEQILRNVGYELLEVPDSHLCCGSAGSYSILQPELSEQLLQRKVANLEQGSPDVIATANVGCQLHLSSGTEVPVRHWLTLLN